MKKDKLFEIEHAEKRLFHGGREVLRLVLEIPQGDCRAATHFSELTALFATFAEEKLFADAAADCEAAFARGEGFCFLRHTATAKIEATRLRRGWRILFSARCGAGDRLLFHRYLLTFWDPEGTLQKPLPRSLQQKKGGKRVGKSKKKGGKFSERSLPPNKS